LLDSKIKSVLRPELSRKSETAAEKKLGEMRPVLCEYLLKNRVSPCHFVTPNKLE